MVPEPIRLYIEEVKQVLQTITEAEAPGHGLHEKLNFLRETRHAFGRTALVLSGGGALGAFHVVSPGTDMSALSCISAALPVHSFAAAAAALPEAAYKPPGLIFCVQMTRSLTRAWHAGCGEGAAREQAAPASACWQQCRLHR